MTNNTLEIKIRQLNSEKLKITIPHKSTVEDLQEEIYKNHKIPINKQLFLFGGSVLKPEDKLSDLDLQSTDKKMILIQKLLHNEQLFNYQQSIQINKGLYHSNKPNLEEIDQISKRVQSDLVLEKKQKKKKKIDTSNRPPWLQQIQNSSGQRTNNTQNGIVRNSWIGQRTQNTFRNNNFNNDDINKLMVLGFSRERVIRCLTRSNGNVSLAANYLLN
ncbi:hypothetical protein M0812_29539 [Anaeramoeba flamelloides]|uniref:Ubiquitin-like protein n=1 Tax=Anaeramoeba flamelloides TaxID=1746091 RepID=A0AAV7Y2D9_9EUKA|nr:hypothetical protein M0812_29539 [Anaeramoeba flamelloides]